MASGSWGCASLLAALVWAGCGVATPIESGNDTTSDAAVGDERSPSIDATGDSPLGPDHPIDGSQLGSDGPPEALPADAPTLDAAADAAAPDRTPPDPGPTAHPRTLHSADQLLVVRNQVAQSYNPTSIFQLGHKQLLGVAASRFNEPISAVVDFAAPDFDSDMAGHNQARALISDDAEAAYVMALISQLGVGLTDSERRSYASKAADIVKAWSRINVSYSGPDGASLMASRGVGFAFAADLVWDEPFWTGGERNILVRWLTDVLRKAGESLSERSHTRAAWGVLAALTANSLLKDWVGVAANVDRLRVIIDERIQPDGALPTELAEGTNSLAQTFNALVGLTAAIEVARNSRGIDLRDWVPPSGGGIRDALEFFFQRGCLQNGAAWPVPNQNVMMQPNGIGGNLMYAMGYRYSSGAYLKYADHPIWAPARGLPWAAASLMPPLP